VTLRARLVLALLVLALIPTAVFTVFTLDQLNRAIGRWYRPGVNRALESALEVTKESLTRLETTVVAQAGDWAASWPHGPLTEARRDELRKALRTSSLDFAQVYRRTPQGWTRIEQITPPGVLLASGPELGPEITSALDSGQPLRSPQGALAGVARLPGDEALVVGAWFAPGFFSDVDQVVHGATYYRQLGVYVDVQRRLVWVLVGAVVGALVLLAVLLSRTLARQMARPLGDLSRAIGQVAAGDLSTRVAPQGARELRSLGTSFNTMTERLEAAREAQQRAEREAAWRDVARKLAHEFKNLLTPMQLSLQLLEEQLQSVPPEQRDSMMQNLRAASSEVENLNRLADQFSQYARLPEPNLETVDLTDIARSVARLETHHEIRVATSEPVWIQGDRLLLSRAVHNLLLNACEASPRDSVVEVSVGSRGDEAWVEILDRGPGISPTLEDRLFEPYVSTKRRGSGLGLSLVRDIAVQHGGAVTLSNRPGGGARARLWVRPAASPAPGAASA